MVYIGLNPKWRTAVIRKPLTGNIWIRILRGYSLFLGYQYDTTSTKKF